MDYSLLLGLDKEKPEVVVGLVDAVGSYGLFKNIESRGKMAFNRGREGEVTIVSGHVISRATRNMQRKQRGAECPDTARSVQGPLRDCVAAVLYGKLLRWLHLECEATS